MTKERQVSSVDNRDVSGRKRLEEASEKSEELLRSYFDSGLVGMSKSLPDARFLQVNGAFCKMLGYSREELLQMHWMDVTHPDDVNEDVENVKRMLAREIDGYTRDKRFIRKDWGIHHVIISVKCYRKEDGTHDYNLAFIQGISERKQIEEELRKSHALFNQAEQIGKLQLQLWGQV